MESHNTRERTVRKRKIGIRTRFREFQEYAEFCNLFDFTLRVSPESVPIRNPISRYPPWHFDFFEDLYKQMSEEERRMYYPSLKLLYEMLLLKYKDYQDIQDKMMFLRRTFTLLLRSAEFIGPETVSSLITDCQKALDMEVCDFQKIVPVKDWSVFSRCFPTHQSVGFGWDNIRKSRKLIRSLEIRSGRCVPLIQHGFDYGFDQNYYTWRVLYLLCEDSSANVKGKLLKNEINDCILDSGSLRLQMAMELLVALFDETYGYDKNVLELLWRAVPFPYISSVEMSTLLSPFFEGKDLKLQELCDEYKQRNTLFEVPQVTQPRSLKHLSGVQVRKCMCDANTIGDDYTINGLDIPSILKDYLKLPFREVYFDALPEPDFIAADIPFV